MKILKPFEYIALGLNAMAALLTIIIVFMGTPMGNSQSQINFNILMNIFDYLVVLAPVSMLGYIIIEIIANESNNTKEYKSFNFIFTSLLPILVLLLFFANFVPFYGERSVLMSSLHKVAPYLITLSIFLIPIIIIVADLKLKGTRDVNDSNDNSNQDQENNKSAALINTHKADLFRVILLTLVVLLGCYMSIPIIVRPDYGILAWIGIFSAMIGFMLFFVYLSVSVSIFRVFIRSKMKKRILKMRKIYSISQIIAATSCIIGIIVAFTFISPVFYMPNAVRRSNSDFSAVFGDPENIGKESLDASSSSTDAKITTANSYFLSDPYHISSSFINYPIPQVEIRQDILYFNGTASSYDVDRNITLYFDAFIPKGTPEEVNRLPGRNSTIIRIHGGGWAIGDKGMMNIGDMNRYLAAQGYIVFDIQYGLTTNKWHAGSLTPDNVAGNFTIDDMMRHIGNFTFYLEKHYSRFGANLSSVFISGGSAGGQLTCAAALAINSGNYTDLFSNKLTICGLIPYYPANFIYDYVYIPGAPEFLNPELMIDSTAPPCLIFQGLHDGMVNPEVSASFKNKYEEENRKCAVIWLPKAGHAADLYFPGYYNMMFLYYMERFLYIMR